MDLAPGQDLTAIMKPSELSNFDFELYDPACNPVPPGQGTVNNQPTSVPETVRIVDAAGGRYKLRVQKVSGGGNYMLGVAVNP